MPCLPFTLPGGGRGFICSRSRRPAIRCRCGNTAKMQCDAPVSHRSGTCDRYLCGRCAIELGPDVHVCSSHMDAKLPGAVQQLLAF